MSLIKNTVSLAEMVQIGPSLAADVVLLGLNDAPGRRPRCLVDLGCAGRAAAQATGPWC